MTGLSYDNGKYALGETDVPVAMLWKLANRTFSHIMGNEAASAFKSAKGVSDEAAFLTEWRTKKIEAIKSGQLGIREGGPRKDPVETKFESLVVRFVQETLKSAGLKLPKTDDDVITMGNGSTRTRSQMLANARASQGERLHREAERLVAAEARLTKVAKQEPGSFDPAAAGL